MIKIDTFSPYIPPEFDYLFESTPFGVVDTLAGSLDNFINAVPNNRRLIVSAQQVLVPDRMLSRRLLKEEKSLINTTLGPQYATEAVSAQKEIANVPIRETHERMVNLVELFSTQPDIRVEFSQTPYHPSCGEWAGRPRLFWVRQGFADRLLPFFSGLNAINTIPRIEDAFRPVGVQEGLFRRRYQATKNEHPDWGEDQVITESMSKTAVTPRLASHKAGAALDFMFLDENKNDIDIGNEYPEGGAITRIDCPFVTPDQWVARQVFKNTANMAGLSLYPWEDWHVSYRDNLSGLDLNKLVRRRSVIADYGPIKEFDQSNGIIKQIYSEHELDQTFPGK